MRLRSRRLRRRARPPKLRRAVRVSSTVSPNSPRRSPPDDWTTGPTRRRDGRFVVASRRSGGRVLQAVADGGPEGEVLLDLLDRLVHELVVPIVVAQVGVDPFHAPEAIPAPLP